MRMSRSYKKTPIITDSSKSYKFQPSPKTVANRILRSKLKSELKHAEKSDFINLLTHKKSTFKRYYESYDICDFKFRPDFSDSPTELLPYSAEQLRSFYQK